MKRNFRGVWIPRDVYTSKELSWSEKILLVEIDSLSNNGECNASNGYFADFLGITEQSVSRSIGKLRDLGYVDKYVYKRGRRVLGTPTLKGKESPAKAPKIDDRGRFEAFWGLYNKKVGKSVAKSSWDKMSDQERDLALQNVSKYVVSTPELKYRKHAATWLNQRGWEDEYDGSGGKGIQSGNNKGMIL